MRYLPPDDSNVNPIEQSADLTKALKDKSATFAAQAARSAFGRFYTPPEHAVFCDHSPEELRQLRVAAWLGITR